MKITCLNCGHKNSEALKFCEKCNSPLKSWDGIAAGKVTKRLEQFIEAVEKIKAQKWSIEEFANFIEITSQKLNKIIQGTKEIAADILKELKPFFEEELETGFGGMKLYKEGINKLKHYLETSDLSYLDEGIKLIRQGNDKINEARTINKDRKFII